MKICFFPHFSFSNRDGATLSMYNIIDVLTSRGHQVVVVLPNENNLEERLGHKEIKFIHVPMYSMRMTIDRLNAASRAKFLLKYLHNQRCVSKIVSLLKDEKIDVVHINGLDSSVGAKVARKLGVPVVWHVRQFMEDDLGKKLFREKETYDLARRAEAVVGISKDVAAKFEKVFGRPVRLVYNGIPRAKYELRDHEILREKPVKLLLAGRISLQKGQMVAVRAVELLKNEGEVDCRLTLIGQGETKEYLAGVESYIRDHGLSEHVTVLGHSDDLLSLRGEHDIGLTCSQKEAFGRVTVENMMAGMLAIGAASGGTPEIITDGTDGYLYKVDDPEDLARVIKKAVKDPETSRAVAKRGYQRSLDVFSIERVVDEVESIYREVV